MAIIDPKDYLAILQGGKTVIDQVMNNGVLPPPFSVTTEPLNNNNAIYPGSIKRGPSGEILKEYIEYKGLTSFLTNIYDNWLIRRLPEQIYSRTIDFGNGREVRFDNLVIIPPHYSRNGNPTPLTPKYARDNDLTYAIELRADFVIGIRTEKGFEEADRRRGRVLGQVPLMLGSTYCVLHGKTADEREALGEDAYDPDGYFIVKGDEKVTLIQELLGVNQIFLFNLSNKGNAVCRMTIPTVKGTVIVQLLRLPQKDTDPGGLEFQGNSLGKDKSGSKPKSHSVGAFQVMRMLGVNGTDQMLQWVLMFTKREWRKRVALQLVPTILKHNYYTNDLDYLASKSGKTNITKEEKEAIKKRFLDEDIFPNMNDMPLPNKVGMVAIMIARMAEYMAGFRPLDDRDSWSNKILKTAGVMIEQLFRILFRKSLTEIQKDVNDKRINGLEAIVNAWKSNIITEGFSDSFRTANWGVKGISSKPNVAQTLKRGNRVDVYSHLTKTDVETTRHDKQPNIRTIQSTQFGFICPVETPEGETCKRCEDPVAMADGTFRPIGELKDGDIVLTIDPITKTTIPSAITKHFVKWSDDVHKITLISLKTEAATGDHPFLTDRGFVKLDSLVPGKDRLCIKNVQVPMPNVQGESITYILFNHRMNQILEGLGVKESLRIKHQEDLKSMGLFPLSDTHPHLPILARIAGFVTADGHLGISAEGKPDGSVCFGLPINAEYFNQDLVTLGYEARAVSYAENTMVDKSGRETTHHAHNMHLPVSLASLLLALGMPYGRKTVQASKPVPSWIMNGSKLIKREFLAGLMGGDGFKLQAHKRHDKVTAHKFNMNRFEQQKAPEHTQSCVEYMKQLQTLFNEFGVGVTQIYSEPEPVNENREIITLKFCTKETNIVNFMTNIGFRYDITKSTASFQISEYLRYKQLKIAERDEFKRQVYELYDSGVKQYDIARQLGVRPRLVGSVIEYRRDVQKRQIATNELVDGEHDTLAPPGTISFEQWCELTTADNDCLYVPIQSIEKEPGCMVSDFTTIHDNHTMISANGIISHNCGILKNLAITASITSSQSDIEIVKAVEGRYTLFPEGDRTGKLLINGRWYGFCSAVETKNYLLGLRRQGRFPEGTTIIMDKENFLYVRTDGDRLIRPLLIVGQNQKLEIDNKKLRGASIPQLINNGCLEYVDPFEQEYIKLAPSANALKVMADDIDTAQDYVANAEANLASLLRGEAIVETTFEEIQGQRLRGLKRVNPSEEAIKSAQISLDQARQALNNLLRKQPYTHCELDPQAILGISASLIPFPNHNQAPRNTYQTSMSKQAVNVYHSHHNSRFDGKTKVAVYPTRPLLDVEVGEQVGLHVAPQGEQVIVCFSTYTGYTPEDAFVFNRASIELGKFRMLKYINKELTFKSSGDIKELMGRPALKKGEDPDRYKYMTDQGLPMIGAQLKQGDAVIGKIIRNETNGEVFNNSEFMMIGEEGIVDKVHVSTDDLSTTVKVKLRMPVMPVEGDKLAARNAQKATIGLILDPEDMPFTESGIRPDIIVNPHSIPSRMTMSYMMELIAGKVAALRGERINASAFQEFDFDNFRAMLRQYGFNEYGYETMTSGITGKMIKTQIYIGPCYFQRLKHVVADKIQMRGIGATKTMTHQPHRGRTRGGGVRFGEMERDSIISHGAAAFLQERLCGVSDEYEAVFCKTCGTFASTDITTVKYECRKCKTKGNFGRAKIPYAFKYLVHLLAPMGIYLRFDMLTQEEYTVSLTAKKPRRQIASKVEEEEGEEEEEPPGLLEEEPEENVIEEEEEEVWD